MPITSLDVLTVGSQWPPRTEVSRMANYRRYRDLMKPGRHDRVFQDVIKMMREQKRMSDLQLIQLGFPRRLIKPYADLVLGEPPSFTAEALTGSETDNAKAQEQVETYVEESGLLSQSRRALTDLQALGDGLLKVSSVEIAKKANGEPELFPRITCNTPTVWYPVVSPDDCKEITAHILAWTWDECTNGHTTRISRPRCTRRAPSPPTRAR
jgi:hypothetical protein